MHSTVAATQSYGPATLLTLAFRTPNEAPSVAGRYFMARASDGEPMERPWDPYLRRALFPVAYTVQEGAPLYTLLIPADDDSGHRWLAARQPGDSIDLLGPTGNGFALDTRSRALLLVAESERAPLLFPLVHDMLDRNGRVTLLLRAADANPRTPDPLALLLSALPLAVEARVEPEATFASALTELAPWADQVCIALGSYDSAPYTLIARLLRATRLRLDPGFAHVLWPGALPCGIGACLACLAPLAGGGFTRTCVHGPVLDLTRIAA